jgi:hypothetical protein
VTAEIEAGGAVADDKQQGAEPAGDEITPELEPAGCETRIPSITERKTRAPFAVNPQATSMPSLGPSGRTGRNTASRNSATIWMS